MTDQTWRIMAANDDQPWPCTIVDAEGLSLLAVHNGTPVIRDRPLADLVLAALNAPAADVIAAVLADHPRGDWSDSTHSCQGCNNRTRQEVEARWADATDHAERLELRARASHASKPDWTRAEYDAHVAEHIVAALTGAAS